MKSGGKDKMKYTEILKMIWSKQNSYKKNIKEKEVSKESNIIRKQKNIKICLKNKNKQNEEHWRNRKVQMNKKLKRKIEWQKWKERIIYGRLQRRKVKIKEATVWK